MLARLVFIQTSPIEWVICTFCIESSISCHGNLNTIFEEESASKIRTTAKSRSRGAVKAMVMEPLVSDGWSMSACGVGEHINRGVSDWVLSIGETVTPETPSETNRGRWAIEECNGNAVEIRQRKKYSSIQLGNSVQTGRLLTSISFTLNYSIWMWWNIFICDFPIPLNYFWLFLHSHR